jgi:hypothetical protein
VSLGGAPELAIRLDLSVKAFQEFPTRLGVKSYRLVFGNNTIGFPHQRGQGEGADALPGQGRSVFYLPLDVAIQPEIQTVSFSRISHEVFSI